MIRHTATPTPHQSFPQRVKNWLVFTKDMIVQSVTNLDFYVEVLNYPLKFSLATLAFFYTMIGIAATIAFTFVFLPPVQDTALRTLDSLDEQIPKDTLYSWDGTTLSSESTQPLSLNLVQDGSTTPLLTIDTTTENAPEHTDGAMFVNKNSYFIRNENEWAIQPLQEALGTESQTFDYSLVEQAQAERDNVVRFFQALPFIFFPAFVIGIFLVRLITVLLYSFLVSFLLQLMHKPLNYAKTVQMLLHVLIPVEIINTLSLILYRGHSFPIFGISFWLLTAIILWHLRNLQVVKFEVKEK